MGTPFFFSRKLLFSSFFGPLHFLNYSDFNMRKKLRILKKPPRIRFYSTFIMRIDPGLGFAIFRIHALLKG